MVATVFILLAAATTYPQLQNLPPLDRRASKNALHEAEKQLAAHRLRHRKFISSGRGLYRSDSRPEPHRAARRAKSSNMVEHRGFGLEIDPRYCDCIVRRYIALAGARAVSATIAERYRLEEVPA